MLVPEALAGWSYEAIVDLCGRGLCETDRHDFKYGLQPTEEHTKLCCAFANTRGGFLVVGVKDDKGRFTPSGTAPDGEMSRKFGERLKAEPTIYYEAPRVISAPNSENVIYVFHIPLSPDRPHAYLAGDRHARFWKRTNRSCEPMSVAEVREQFLRYEERRDRVTLLLLELKGIEANLAAASQELQDRPSNEFPLVSLDSSVLMRLVLDCYPLIRDDEELVPLLLELRSLLDRSHERQQHFLAQSALHWGSAGAITVAHRQAMYPLISAMIQAIRRSLQLIQTRFAISPPQAPAG